MSKHPATLFGIVFDTLKAQFYTLKGRLPDRTEAEKLVSIANHMLNEMAQWGYIERPQ